jgi:AraC-like DNA-binding protein
MSVIQGTPRLPLLEASDAEGAHEHIAKVYIPHRLVPHDKPSLGFKMAYFETPRLTFGHVTYGADSELLCPAMETHYHLNLTLAGHTRVQQGGRQSVTAGRTVGGAFNPSDSYKVRWSPDAVQYGLKLPSWALDEQIALLLGRPAAPVHFELTFDLSGERGHGLLGAVTHLRNQYASMSTSGIAARALVSQLESYVLTQVLLTARHNHSKALFEDPPNPGRKHVQEAVRLLEDRAAEPWTIEELARAVCIGARALQIGFRKEMGMTPMEYLREVRLRRTREELMNSAAPVQVSDVATRWGFYHFGRFSQLYRERFGMLPSDTLRRTFA